MSLEDGDISSIAQTLYIVYLDSPEETSGICGICLTLEAAVRIADEQCKGSLEGTRTVVRYTRA